MKKSGDFYNPFSESYLKAVAPIGKLSAFLGFLSDALGFNGRVSEYGRSFLSRNELIICPKTCFHQIKLAEEMRALTEEKKLTP